MFNNKITLAAQDCPRPLLFLKKYYDKQYTQHSRVYHREYEWNTCPSKLNGCYHVIRRDLPCSPYQILNLAFRSSVSCQYAEVPVNRKQVADIFHLISSNPYLKDCLESHPLTGNSNAFLIRRISNRNFGKKLTSNRLNVIYRNSFFS
jgi:hypothetical protein